MIVVQHSITLHVIDPHAAGSVFILLGGAPEICSFFSFRIAFNDFI